MRFEKDEIEGLLNDLFLVGPRKPLGYLPISTVQGCGRPTWELVDDARSKGLRAETWLECQCSIGSGAVYVWDAVRVEEFLSLNHEVLASSGWPDDHYGFVRKQATEQIAMDTPLHQLLDSLYSGGYYNSLSISCPDDFRPFKRGFAGYIWNGSSAEEAMRSRYS